MATTRNGKKRHNWVTNSTIVDDETNKTAARFIDSCVHLTPAREAELDNLIGVGTDKTDHEPDPEIVGAMEDEDWGDSWMDQEPTAADLRAIETGK